MGNQALRTLLGIFFLIAIFRKDTLSILFCLVLCGIYVIYLLWNRFCFLKIKVQRSLSKEKIFLGEESEYIIEIENRKPIPMHWLELTDLVTRGILFENSKMIRPKIGSPYNVFTNVFSLNWYEKVTRRYSVKPIRRGYFTFGKGELQTSDLIGSNRQSLELNDSVKLLVYPRILPIEKIGLNRANPFGKNQANQWIYSDPANKVGIRPYQWGDRLNQINWKATARHQKLHSNIIKPTMDVKLQLILNAKSMNKFWEGLNSQGFELSVICAASIAEYALKEQYQVGLLTNGIIYEESSFTRIKPGKSSKQRQKIMEALAMIEPCPHFNIDQMIKKELPKLDVGIIVVFITSIMNEELVDCLRKIQLSGYSPTLIKVGDLQSDYAKHLAGMPVYTVLEEELLDEIENIQFIREFAG